MTVHETIFRFTRRHFRKRSEESIMHRKETVKNKPFVTCPYCGLRAKQSPNMTRYHFENCKFKRGI